MGSDETGAGVSGVERMVVIVVVVVVVALKNIMIYNQSPLFRPFLSTPSFFPLLSEACGRNEGKEEREERKKGRRAGKEGN